MAEGLIFMPKVAAYLAKTDPRGCVWDILWKKADDGGICETIAF